MCTEMIAACCMRADTHCEALVGELPVTGKSIVWKHPNVPCRASTPELIRLQQVGAWTYDDLSWLSSFSRLWDCKMVMFHFSGFSRQRGPLVLLPGKVRISYVAQHAFHHVARIRGE